MPRQRRHDHHARLGRLDVLLEMQQRAERRDVRHLFGDLDLAVADHDAVDAVIRPGMGQARARDQLIGRGQVAGWRMGEKAEPLSMTPTATKPSASARTGNIMSVLA